VPAGHDDRRHDESGQVLVLTLGLVVLVVALVLVGAAATAVHLERTRLLAVADLAALAAAAAVADEAYYTDAPPVAGGPPGADPDTVPLLTDAAVRAAVEDYLAGQAEAMPDTLTLVAADTPDGRSARVVLVAVVRPPLVGGLLAPWSDGVRIEATSVARPT